MEVVRGALPEWARSYGDGYGYGYGDGYGAGAWDGSGAGDGSVAGDGDGSGDVYGNGYGDGSSGYGYGDDLIACKPGKHAVTAESLLKGGACVEVVRKFQLIFPDGGTWPDDIDKARAAGLDVLWCRRLGLLEPL